MTTKNKIVIGLTGVAVGVFAFFLTRAAIANEFSAGFNYGNGICGTGEVSASMVYDRDDDGIPAHLRLGVSPNGSCSSQALTVDALVEARRYFGDTFYGVAGAGYDIRSLPFEYEPAATKQFYGQEVETAQALFGAGYDGGNWYVQATYNAVETDLADGGKLFPVQATFSIQHGDLEFNATSNVDTHQFDATYVLGQIEVSGRVSFGFDKLGSPAPDYLMADGMKYMRLGAPDPLYSFDIRWRL